MLQRCSLIHIICGELASRKRPFDAKGRGTLIAKALGWHRPFDGNDKLTLKPKAVRWQSMGTLKGKPFDCKGPSMAKSLSSMANSLRW
jgi:hypothetical protein